jgi:hypothetical protein
MGLQCINYTLNDNKKWTLRRIPFQQYLRYEPASQDHPTKTLLKQTDSIQDHVLNRWIKYQSIQFMKLSTFFRIIICIPNESSFVKSLQKHEASWWSVILRKKNESDNSWAPTIAHYTRRSGLRCIIRICTVDGDLEKNNTEMPIIPMLKWLRAVDTISNQALMPKTSLLTDEVLKHMAFGSRTFALHASVNHCSNSSYGSLGRLASSRPAVRRNNC